jgi:hypothetical protein
LILLAAVANLNLAIDNVSLPSIGLALLVVPSDPVFVAVGLGALPAASSFIAFFLARSVFNTVMVLGAGPAVSNLTDLFAGRLPGAQSSSCC